MGLFELIDPQVFKLPNAAARNARAADQRHQTQQEDAVVQGHLLESVQIRQHGTKRAHLREPGARQKVPQAKDAIGVVLPFFLSVFEPLGRVMLSLTQKCVCLFGAA